jgi:hypothetical protein
MSTKKKVFYRLSGAAMLLFALSFLAWVGVRAYYEMYGDQVVTMQYPNLYNIIDVFTFTLPAVFNNYPWMQLAVPAVPAVLLVVLASLLLSKYKGRTAKFVACEIVGLVVMTAFVIWLTLSLGGYYVEMLLFRYALSVYGIVAAVCLYGLPALSLIFGLVALLSSRDATVKDDVTVAGYSDDDILPIETPKAPITRLEDVKPLVNTAPNAGKVVPDDGADDEPLVVLDIVEEPKVKPIFEPHIRETTSEIVARSYGDNAIPLDPEKQKQLDKIKLMLDKGAITQYEYQQLTLRIMKG